MQILGSAELKDDVQAKELCVDCGACVGQCPYFKSHKGKIAMLFPCTIPHGRCYAHCPKTEVDLENISSSLFGKPYEGQPLGHYLEIKKARAGLKMKGNGRFQNGGTVSSLMLFAMKSGMIDAAALTDRNGLIPIPVLATSESEILSCSSSKYMAAPTLASVNEPAGRVFEKIGVVGTPCQLTAVAQMKLDPLKRDDFRDNIALSIGLLCTWALDTRKFIHMVSGLTDISKIVSMDVPPPPASVMEIQTTEGAITISLDDIRKAVPGGCAICPDMTAEFSDVSVGAMEGDSSWNTLIIRTEKGASLVEKAVSDGYLEMDDMPAESIENLTKGASGKKKRALLKARKDKLLNNNPESGRSALLIDDAIVEKILA